MNINISFSEIALNTKIDSNLRIFFIKCTLIQFHFRMAKMYMCPFSTPMNEGILRKIDSLIKQLLVTRCFNYHAFSLILVNFKFCTQKINLNSHLIKKKTFKGHNFSQVTQCRLLHKKY